MVVVLDANTQGVGLICFAATGVTASLVLEEVGRWSRWYSGLTGLAVTLVLTAARRTSGTRRAGESAFTTFWVVAICIVTSLWRCECLDMREGAKGRGLTRMCGCGEEAEVGWDQNIICVGCGRRPATFLWQRENSLYLDKDGMEISVGSRSHYLHLDLRRHSRHALRSEVASTTQTR